MNVIFNPKTSTYIIEVNINEMEQLSEELFAVDSNPSTPLLGDLSDLVSTALFESAE